MQFMSNISFTNEIQNISFNYDKKKDTAEELSFAKNIDTLKVRDVSVMSLPPIQKQFTSNTPLTAMNGRNSLPSSLQLTYNLPRRKSFSGLDELKPPQSSLFKQEAAENQSSIKQEESVYAQSSRRLDTQSPLNGPSNTNNGSPNSMWRGDDRLSNIVEMQVEDENEYEHEDQYEFEIDIKTGMYIKPLAFCSSIIHKSDIYLNLFMKKGKINMEFKLTQHQNEEEKTQKYDIEIDESIEFDTNNFISTIAQDIKDSIHRCPESQRKTLFMKINYNKNILTENMKEAIAKAIPFPSNSELFLFQYETQKPLTRKTQQFKDVIENKEKYFKIIVLPRDNKYKQKKHVYIWDKIEKQFSDVAKCIISQSINVRSKSFTYEEDLSQHSLKIDKISLQLLSIQSFIQKNKLKTVTLNWKQYL